MRHSYKLFVLCVCSLIVLCCTNNSYAATKTVKGVTYTYEIIDAKQKNVKILKADNVPLEYEIPRKIGMYNVMRIGKAAFAGCRIHTLKIAGIPLKNIERFAFSNNEELHEVNFAKEYKKIYLGRDWFTDCPWARIVIRPTVKEIVIKTNANAGTLVIRGADTKMRGLKKLSADKYYLQFENIEIPAKFVQKDLLKKSYYGVVNDTSEERYDSDSNDYSHSKLNKVGLQNTNTARINTSQLMLKEKEKENLRILNISKRTNIVWKSENPSVAMVNKRGLVQAKKVGVTTVMAKAGKKKFRCRVKVYSNLNIHDILIEYHNEIFTQNFYMDNLHRITVHGDKEKEITSKVTIKKIFAELSSLELKKSKEESNLSERYLAMNFETDSGERQIILYENGAIGVKGKGIFYPNRNAYNGVKSMLY